MTIVTIPGEEMKAKTLLDTTCSASTLLGVGSRDEGFDQPRQLSSLVESTETSAKQDKWEQHSDLISLCFPVSMTHVTSGMVMPVSAMFVARTTFLTPCGGTRNAFSCSSLAMVECSG